MKKSVSPISSACEWSLVTVRGTPCLYTEMRINIDNRATAWFLIKHGFFIYNVRRSGDEFSAEFNQVYVDFAGTLISKANLGSYEKNGWFNLTVDEGFAIMGTPPVIRVMEDDPLRIECNDDSLEELGLTLTDSVLKSLRAIRAEQFLVIGAYADLMTKRLAEGECQ